MRQPYPSDLTDEQWELIEPLIPTSSQGRPREVDMREVVNAIFYQARSGCQWDMLPHDFPAKSTVYEYFAQWRDDGTWQRIIDTLRQQVRQEAGRDPSPSAGSIDSQTVKGTEVGGPKGYDGGKKLRGRKRHIVVDPMGLLLVVAVTAASADDGTTAPQVLERLTEDHQSRLELIWADNKYHNQHLESWMKTQQVDYQVQVVERPAGSQGFVLLARRWVVERTFAWLGRYRRLSRDYERTVESSESMIQVSSIHRMLRRLRPDKRKPHNPFRYPRIRRKTVSG